MNRLTEVAKEPVPVVQPMLAPGIGWNNEIIGIDPGAKTTSPEPRSWRAACYQKTAD